MTIAANPSIVLNAKEKEMLDDAQVEGLKRGMSLLSSLTYDWEALAWQAASSAVNIANSQAFASDSPESKSGMERASTSADDIVFDKASSAIKTLLGKAWDKVEAKIISDPMILRLVKVLKLGLSTVLAWIKKIVLSAEVLGKLVPFYGAVSGMIDGAKLAFETHGHRTAFDNIKETSKQIAAGFPSVAIDAFGRYVKIEAVRSGLKTAYTFAKTLASVLLQVFTMGISSVVDFATSIFEAVSSFAYSAFQAITFGKATELCRECVKEKKLMSIDDFRTICASSAFVGCVFFGAANYIGHFNLTAVLSEGTNTISSSSMMGAVAKVGETQKLASRYVASSAFEMKFMSNEEESQYGWALKMMKGYANDAPKSEFLTDNASRFTKFKHMTKKLYFKLKS